MQNLNFILSLEKDSLNQMRLELLNLNSKKHLKSQDIELNMVRFDEFCCALLDHIAMKDGKMNSNLKTEELISFIRSLSLFFDSVDVDSRGFVSFIDFSNFCLRVGRMQFKPSMKRSLTTYTQDLTNSPQYPIGQLCYLTNIKSLFTFDSDTPVVRTFRKDGRFLGKINPVSILKRTLKLRVPTGSLTYHDKKIYGKEFARAKNAERDLNPTKGCIHAMVYVDTTKQFVFSCSASYLIFCVCTASTVKSEDDLNIMGYAKSNYPHIGIIYCKALDLLICWPGEGSDQTFEVWDPHTRTLRLRVERHTSKILSVCEVLLDQAHPLNSHYFASSSIDGKVILWSTAPISALTYKNNKMMRASDALQFELRGHSHAVRSLVYAPDHELILGAGFDFEVFAWDPHTRDIVMRLVGHFKSLIAVVLVMTPNEKVATIDEGGVLKVWNIDKEQGLFGEQIQSLQVQCPLPVIINDFIAAFNHGNTLAVLAERMYMVSIEPESVDNMRPINRGLGYCEGSSRMWVATRNAFNIIDLTDGSMIKRLSFLDQDRVSSDDVIGVRPKEETKPAATATTSPSKTHTASSTGNTGALSTSKSLSNVGDSAPVREYKTSYIDPKDTITAVASDSLGKKVVIGSMDGRVLLFDSYTFGLLVQLTSEIDDANFRSQGSVAALHYVQRDELIIAAYSNGAVKILVGCHRTHASSKVPDTQQQNHHQTGYESDDDCVAEYPVGGGGKPPSRPFLLRESDLGAVSDNSVNGVAFTESWDLIATCTKDAYIYVYDYITMELLSVLKIPRLEDKQPSCVEIHFLPEAPVLLAIDSVGRVTAWTVRPMKCKWINTWSLYHNVTYDGSEDTTSAQHPGAAWSSRGSVLSDMRGSATVAAPKVGLQLTCMQCFLWSEKQMLSAQFIRQQSGLIDELPEEGGKSFVGRMRRGNSAATLNHDDAAHSGGTGGTANFPHRMSRQRTKKNLIEQQNADALAPKKEVVRRVWSILVGDEGGNVMCQDITLLVEKSGAAAQLPKANKSLPVYQRIKSRAYKGFSNSGTATKHPLSAAVQAMLAHPVGDFGDRMDLVTQSRMAGQVKYVAGVRKWIAFSGDPVRIILPLRSDLYTKYKENGTVLHTAHRGSVMNLKDAAAVEAAALASALGGPPDAVYTVSEFGTVKMWSWDGQLLGQVKDEEVTPQQQALKLHQKEQALLRSAAQPEEVPMSLSDGLTATTFVTTVFLDAVPENVAERSLQHDVNRPSSPPKLMRKLSVVPKKKQIGSSTDLVGVSQAQDMKHHQTLTTGDMAAQILTRNTAYTVVDSHYEGWIFPSVSLKMTDHLSHSDHSSNFSHSRIARYTLNQHKYYSCIIAWALPYINKHVVNLHEELNRTIQRHQSRPGSPIRNIKGLHSGEDEEVVHAFDTSDVDEQQTAGALARSHSHSPLRRSPTKGVALGSIDETRQLASHPPADQSQLHHVPSSYDSKFKSTENLLMGINSFFIRRGTVVALEAMEIPKHELVETRRLSMAAEKKASASEGVTFLTDQQEHRSATNSPSHDKIKHLTIDPAAPPLKLSLATPTSKANTLKLGDTANQSTAAAFSTAGHEAPDMHGHQGRYLASLSAMNVVNEIQEERMQSRRDKSNLVSLIDHIQDSSVFDADLKAAPSSSLRFKNLETEQFLRRKDRFTVSIYDNPEFSDLIADALKDYPNDKDHKSKSTLKRPSSATGLSRSHNKEVFALAPNNKQANETKLLTRPKSASTLVRPKSAATTSGARGTSSSRLFLSKSQSKIDNILHLLDNIDYVREEVLQLDLEDRDGIDDGRGSNQINDRRATEVSLGGGTMQCNPSSQSLSPLPSTAARQSQMLSPLNSPGPATLRTNTTSFYTLEDVSEPNVTVPAPLSHCESQRCLEISKRFHETLLSDKDHNPKYELYDPLHEMKKSKAKKAHLRSKVVADAKKNSKSDYKEYIDIETHEFDGVLNVGKEWEKEQLKIAKSSLNKGNEIDRKLYGPYTVKDIFSYLNLTYQLDPLSRVEIERLEPQSKLLTASSNDYDWNPYSGQLVYNANDLIAHEAIVPYPSIVGAITLMMERNDTRLCTENDLIHFLFSYAEEFSRVRIFLFAKVARMLYSIMQNATAPKEAVVIKEKPQAQQQHAKSTGRDEEASPTSPVSPSRHRSVSMDSLKDRQIAQIGTRYIVKPHPQRLFRKWTVKSKEYNRLLRFLDKWYEGKHDSLCIQELVEIFQSMVPRIELETFRILNSMTLLVNRIEYRMTTELTGEVVSRIFENIFEIKVVPG